MRKLIVALLVLVLSVLLVALLGFAQEERPIKVESSISEEIPIEVEVLVPFTIGIETKVRLEEISKKLIVETFPQECRRSSQVIGECNVLQKIEDVFLCELIITFLYQETYTAVLSRIEFEYIPEKVRVYSIEPEYNPEMEDPLPSPPSKRP